ncbi:MAG: hypothetical protein D6690_11420 [Nitrospirae bacterium]|nr:MAG: hypothetical protein D6690_11420 [Nitrospirota bacterium]
MHNLTKILLILYICVLWSSGGCGVVGPPIPPEDVGIEAKMREQASQHPTPAQTTESDTATDLETEPVSLPPLRPVGER